jgi:S-DNA-T family DNA segregation ATPase FtsK/SpoIIIE
VRAAKARPGAGQAPPIAVLDRGMFLRERVRIPLWVTMLQLLGRGLRASAVGLYRLTTRHPVLVAVVTALITVEWIGGTRAVLSALIGLVALVAVVAAGWWWLWPESWRTKVVTRAWGWWRWQIRYRRRWRRVMQGCGLVQVHDEAEFMPQVGSVRSDRVRDELAVRLAPGQVPDDFAEVGEALGHALRAWGCSVRTAGPGWVTVQVMWVDPLTETVAPADGLNSDGGPDSDNEVTGGTVLDRLSSVLVGVVESGAPWVLSLLPGRHLLVAGSTGAGKSGLLWAILWHLRDLIRSGWVDVVGFDPKWVELRAMSAAGLGRVVTDVRTMPEQLERLVADMDARCAEMTGRKHVPTLAEPVRIVIVDELATLTALANSADKKRVEAALGHLLSRGRAAGYVVILTTVEPTKEVVRWRGLCPVRVCYRTDDEQADLVLGDGAHDRGALTEQISEDTPGVAFARIEGRRDIARVRSFLITDDDIASLSVEDDDRRSWPEEVAA